MAFGAWLRSQRELREIPLPDIAEATKISLRFLDAFEQERFDALPAPVFSRGFLREYALYVGLDPDEVVNRYLSARKELEPEPQEASSGPRRSGSPNWGVGFLLGLLGVLVLAAVAWLAFQSERSRAADEPAPPVSTAPAPATTRSQSPAPAATAVTGESGEGSDASAASGTEEAVAVSDSPIRVTLDFKAECWVEIVVDGRRRIEQLRVQDEALLIDAESSVAFITLGEAEAVEVQVNGIPFSLPRETGVVRNVRIDLETVRALTENG